MERRRYHIKRELIMNGKEVTGPELMEQVGYAVLDTDLVTADTATVIASEAEGLIKQKDPNIDTSFINLSDVRHRNQVEYWLKRGGVEDDHATKLNRKLWGDEQLLCQAEPIKGSQELIDWFLEDHKINVKFHTSRPDDLSLMTKML